MPTEEILISPKIQLCYDKVFKKVFRDNPNALAKLISDITGIPYLEIKDNIIFSSKVISFLREEMTDDHFLEITTPILTASSPEGARDFIVPSRKYQGKFYALPQAPQQFKQLLMCAGFDRYFQIAPCFRDEDARSDRVYGEFYKLDLEMAFATEEDVLKVDRKSTRLNSSHQD